MLRRQQTNKNLIPASPPLPPPAAQVKKEEFQALADQVSEMREHLDAVTKAIAAQLNVALDTIDANLRASRDESARLDAKVDDALRVIASSEQAIEERVATTLENRTAEMQTVLDERSARITVDTEFKLEQAEARLAARLTDSVKDTQAFVDSLGAKVDSSVEAVNAKVDSSVNELSTKVDLSAAEQASRYERLTETVNRIRDDLASTTVALRHEMEQTSEILSTRLAARSDELRVELANLRSLMDGARAELADRLNKVSEQATGTAFSLMQLQDRVGEVDANALNELRERVSSVAGEGALVRIEMDRLTNSIDDRFDKVTVRLADIDAKLDNDEDVSLAVQLDRLDELERAIAEFDPDRFVLKDEPQSPPTGAPDGSGRPVGHGFSMNGHAPHEPQQIHTVSGYNQGSGW